MIGTDEGLAQTRGALANLEDALLCLKRDVLPKNPKRFALMAEIVVEKIGGLRREIDEYIGYTFAVAQQSEPEIARMLEGTDFAPSPENSASEMPQPAGR